MSKTITITRPDDWHLHVRDGTVLNDVLAHTAAQFGRAIIMPNLKPPVTTVDLAKAYEARIQRALKQLQISHFSPLMTLYLTDNTSADEVKKASENTIIGFKLYPVGATTNSDGGVTDIKKAYPALEAMQRFSVPLLIHGEVTEQAIDIFDREAVFIDRILDPIRKDFPELRIVFEHITTKQAAHYVRDANTNGKNTLAATITAHHLLMNRNSLFTGGIRPHFYCLPILKREDHRLALLQAATSGNPKFFLGTDSAPHSRYSKESSCGCAGCYSALHALELYAEAFESVDAIEQLEGFASFHGADFYQLPRNTEQITLTKTTWRIPDELPFPESGLVPLRAGEEITWQLGQ